jgi:hypothetical protein
MDMAFTICVLLVYRTKLQILLKQRSVMNQKQLLEMIQEQRQFEMNRKQLPEMIQEQRQFEMNWKQLLEMSQEQRQFKTNRKQLVELNPAIKHRIPVESTFLISVVDEMQVKMNEEQQ